MNKKMVAVIKMLSATNDAEVLIAARALGRLLREHGKDWNDLGEYLARWNPIADKEYSVTPAAAPPRHTTTNAVKPGWERRAGSGSVDIEIVRSQIDDLMSYHLAKLSRKDSNFIEGLSESFDMYGSNTFISSAQAAWVQSLYTQYVDNKGRRR